MIKDLIIYAGFLLALYGAVMGWVNFSIHKALKHYLDEHFLGDK